MRGLAGLALASALALPAGAADWYVGSGKDGPLSVTGARPENSVHAGITAAIPPGGSTVTVTSAAGFFAGDLVLIRQDWGAGAGKYELARLAGAGGTSLFLTTGTKTGYPSSGAQILVVKEYSSVSVSGGPWESPPYNGSSGGVFAVAVSGNLSMVAGSVNMTTRGFQGGLGGTAGAGNEIGFQGSGTANGQGVRGTGANGVGGGGGGSDGSGGAGAGHGGGGGGHGATGTPGGGFTGGTGGGAGGAAALAAAVFGGGGGGGGVRSGNPGGSGANGGGVVLLFVGGNVAISGGGVSAGGGLGNGGGTAGGGGGGAGGAIRVVSTGTVTLGSGIVSAQGGTGGGGFQLGGTGGGGRIAVLSNSVHSGTTTPNYFAAAGDDITFDDPFTSPGPVTDLRVTAIVSSGLGVSTQTVTLQWTSPGADAGSTVPLAGFYSIRASITGPITTLADYTTAGFTLDLATAAERGSLQTAVIANLYSSHTYFFAIRSTDSHGMTSPLSNLGARATTYVLVQPNTSGNNWGIAAGDMDGDGDLDLVVTQRTSALPYVLRHDGNMVFSKVVFGSAAALKGVALADFDRDGDLDIIAAQAGADKYYRNDGGLSFTESSIPGTSGGATGGSSAVAAADVDGDGDIDAAVANEDTGGAADAIELLLNDGRGEFTVTLIPTTAMRVVDLAWGEFDGDGDPDLAVIVDDGGTDGYVMRNDGAGAAWTKVPMSGTSGCRGVAWSDYDADGDLDIALTCPSATIEIRRNNGGTFGTQVNIPNTANTNESAAWGDADNDGLPDLMASRGGSSAKGLVSYRGGGAFSFHEPAGSAGNARDAAWADFDQDGDLDYAAAHDVGESIVVYRNDVAAKNQRPSKPAPAAADIDFEQGFGADLSTLTFKWDAGLYDGGGSTLPLTYAVAVATVPMGLDPSELRILTPSQAGVERFIISPVYGSPLYGQNHKPRFQVWPGDATAKHGVIVASRPAPGGLLSYGSTYYFRVATIDAGLMRSSWSAQASRFLLDPCATRRSVNDGPWSDPATWDWGVVPTECSAVIVSSNTKVTIDVSSATASTTSVYGALVFSLTTDSTFTLVDGDLSVYAGGTLEMGGPFSGGALSASRKATLVLALGSAAGTYGLLVKPGGNLRIQGGSDKSPFGYAVEEIPIGQSFFRISASSAANWAAGDRLLITRTQGGGASAVDEHIVASVAGTDPLTVNLTAPVTATRVLTSTTAIAVANLTRNVVIRSSGTNFAANTSYVYSLASHATGFIAQQAEFVNMGANYGAVSHDDGLKIGAGAQASFSSCVVRGGSFGLMFDSAASTVSMSVVAKNNFVGVQATGGLRIFLDRVFIGGNGGNGAAFSGSGMAVTVSSSVVAANGGMGLSVEGDSVVSDNRVFANAQHGILRLAADPGTILRRNVSHQNLVDGFNLTGGAMAAEDNQSFGNGGDGFESTASAFLLRNVSSSNTVHGFILSGAHYLASNRAFGNQDPGFRLNGGTHTSVDGFSWSNAGPGLVVQDATVTWAGGALGRNPGLLLAANSTDIGLGAGTRERVFMQKAWFSSVATGNLDNDGEGVLAYGRDLATGTLQTWGDYDVIASTLTLDYGQRVYKATSTRGVLIRGTGHGVSAVSFNDATAVDQLLSFQYDGAAGLWRVHGSSSGPNLTSFIGSLSGLSIPSGSPQVSVNFTQGASPRDGDRLDLLLMSSSQDVNMQKKLLFNPGNSSVNGGRSRVRVAAGAGLELRGVPGFPTVLDRLDAGATYYTIITSGSFTAEHSSVTNMDSGGFQLSLNMGQTVSLATTTFDFMGITAATSAYVTVFNNGLPVQATFYGLTFGNSRSTAPLAVASNIRFVGGSLPNWTLRRWGGALGGEDFDGEPFGNTFQWSPFTPGSAASNFTAITTHSIAAQWTQGANDEGMVYEVQANTYPFANGSIASSFPVSGLAAPVAGLAANTSYFVRIFAAHPFGNGLDDLVFSSPLDFPTTGTLAIAPTPLPQPFLGVFETSAALAWVALPGAPLSASASGYILEASTTNFDGTGALLSSVTYKVAQSTLTVGGPGGLLSRNSTYYFRVGSLNPFGQPNYTALGARSTLANQVAASLSGVFVTSVTATWPPLPPSPPSAVDASGEGYSFEGSSTNFGALAPGGVVYSSVTAAVGVGQLTVAGLTPYVTYYFRVGTLNWSGAANFNVLGATVPVTLKKVGLVGTGGGSRGAAWGDIDKDGDLDAIVVNDVAEAEYLLRNDGAGGLLKVALPTAGNSIGVAWGDHDGDGDLDALVGGYFGSNEVVLRNDGGAFTETPAAAGGSEHGVAWGDYDNDGDLDGLAAGYNGSESSLLRNDGGGAFTRVTLAGTGQNSIGAAWGDYDNDGDLDAIVANAGLSDDEFLLRNDGGGTLVKVPLPGTAGMSSGVAWGDFDKDGDLDAVVGNSDVDSVVLRNDGAGTFVKVAIAGSAGAVGVAPGDYDNDGDLDVLTTRNPGEALLLRNSGGGAFTAIPLAGTGGNGYGVSWGDYDNDGDLDALLAYNPGDEVILRNDGQNGNTLPAAPAGGFNGTFLEFAPFSSSGTLTLSWGNASDVETSTAHLKYWVRVGTVAVPGSSSTLKVPSRFSVDGYSGGSWGLYSTRLGGASGLKLTMQKEATAFWAVTTEDLVGARSAESGAQETGLVAPRAVTDLRVAAQVSTGLGASTMSVTLAWTAPGADGTSGVLNGVYDIRWSSKTPLTSPSAYVAAQYSVQVATSGVTPGTSVYYTFPNLDAAATWYFALSALDSQTYPQGVRSGLSNPATAQAYAVRMPGTGGNSVGVAWGDYDGDGDLDALVANELGQDEVLLRNDGGGVLTKVTLTGTGGSSFNVAWSDYDGDGDLDALLANAGVEDEVLLRNDGGGVLTKVTLTGTGGNSLGVEWGDYDGDGDLDALVANAGVEDEVLLRNDGSGVLTKVTLTGTAGDSRGVAWGDYDGDGDLDGLVANLGLGEDEVLLRNDGNGVLTKVTLTGTGGNSQGAAWGDYDGDGDLDALVANDAGQDEVLLRNDGGGVLTKLTLTGTAGDSLGVAWGDHDGDGDLDALVANYLGQDEVLLRNDGGGVLTKVTLTGTAGDSTRVAWADFDGDGDLDAMVSNYSGQDEAVLRNDVAAANAAPAAPAPTTSNLSLEYDQQGATLTVRWDPGSDGAADTDTITYQLAMATAPMTLSADGKRVTAPSKFAVPWAFGSPSFGSYPRPAFRTWPGTLVPQHGRQLRLGAAGGTLPNGVTYYIRLQAVDAGLARSAWSVELSTFVFAAIPAGGRVVSPHTSSMTVTYSTVPGGTAFFLEAFSDAGFTALVSSAGTSDLARTSVPVSGLAANTTYYLRMGVLHGRSTAYADTVPVATATLPSPPGAVLPDPFPAVIETSMTVRWTSGGNPVNVTTYVVHATTGAGWENSYSGNVVLSTAPAGANLAATLSNLVPNTTYMVLVYARNHNGLLSSYVTAGTTTTRIEAPTGVFFESVATDSIVASATNAAGGFTNLAVGTSATSVALAGVYADWRVAQISTVFSGLIPNTAYAFKSRSRNQHGVVSGETAEVSTFTLAAQPLSAGTTFLAVSASSVSLQWAAAGNPGVTQYRVSASTAPDYNAAASSRASAWFAGTSTSVVALAPYTTWYFRVQARNGNGIETEYTVLGATFTPLFTPVPLAGTGGDSYGARWGDFDADGDLDLLVANFAAGASAVLRNDGGGVFVKLLVGGAPAALDAAWGDFDGDGDLDIAFANYAGDEVVARYDGGAVFTLITLTGTGGASRGVAWGDYDGDGDLDLAVGNDSGQDEVLARNDGGGVFSTAALPGSSGNSMGVAWGDADGDGDLDLLIFNEGGISEVLARNNGAGAFTVSPIGTTAGDNRRGAWADADGDGDLDFVAGGAGAENDYLARNDGTGVFTAASLPGTTGSAEDMSWGDVDADGDLDLIVANAGGPAYLMRNEGGVFIRQDVAQPFGDVRAARWGDFDGDGDLDVGLVSRSGGLDEGLLRNEAQLPNPAPTSPAVGALSLTSGVSGATLTVTWAPGSDSGASTPTLTYAIAVATASMGLSGDSLRVVSPSSFVVAWNQGLQIGDRLSGARSIPFRLDAPNVLTANFKSDATYYIRLQAIDAGLRRGAWSAETSTYVYRAEPPAGRTVTALNVDQFTVAYSTVGAASYLLQASTTADYSGTVHVSSTADPALTSLTVLGLTANTTYHLRMGSLWQKATTFAAVSPAQKVTRSATPGQAPVTWLEVHESSAVVAWLSGGNPMNVTTYTVVASTGSGINSFSGNRTVSTAPAGASPQAVVTGLVPNTTYYLMVAGVNHEGVVGIYLALPSTATRIEAPTGIVFDGISSTTLSARATSAAGGFTGLALGTSAVNFAFGGQFQGWVVGSSVTLSTGLVPNTSYTFKAKARNMGGVETGETADVSTYTFAAVPSTATPTLLGLGVSSISLQWTHNGNPAGTQYLLGVSTDEAFGTGLVRDSGFTTAFSSAIVGLIPNSTYYAGVLAVNAYGIETATRPLGSTVTYAAAPASLVSTWTAVSSASLTAAWDANGNPAGTRFEAALSTAVLPNGLPTNLLVTTAAYGAPAAGFAALTPNTTYYLGARAISHAGVATSQTQFGSTVTLAAVPAASTQPFAGVFLTSMTVQWSSGANPAWTEYRVDAATSADYGGSLWSTDWEALTSTTVSGLTRNTTYHLRVEGRNAARTRTAFLNVGSTSTLVDVPVDGGNPFPIVGLSSVAASWGTAGNPSWTRYEIVIGTLNSTPDDSADEVRVTTTDPGSSLLTGLQANSTFYFFVRAVNWNSVPSDWLALGSTVTRAAQPAAPAGSTFTAVAQSSVTLAWGLGTNPGPTEFQARASTAADFSGVDRLSPWLTGQTTALTGLAVDTTYYWRVTARNRAGVGSEPRDFGPLATLAHGPSISTGAFHRVWVTSATVQWGANGNPASTTYEVQAATSPAFTGAVRESGLVTFLSTTVTGLAGDATYYWRVRAKGVSGVNTDPLLFGSTATSAADPGEAAFAHVGPTAVRAHWGSGGNRDSDSTGVWATRTALPSARERHGTAYASGRAYVVGGLVGGSPSAEVWSVGLSPSGTAGAWRREADLPAPRESHALVADSGRLYVVGGFEGSAKATVFSADLAGDGSIAAWRSEPNLPAARSKLAAVSHGGWLYALGGDNGVVGQAAVYRAPMGVDGRVGAWAAATSLPAARNSHAAAVSGGRVYVAGGLGAGVEEEVWSAALAGPTVGAWQVQTPLPVPVFRHTLAASGGALLLVGGHDGNAAVAHVRSAPLGAGGDVGAWVELGAVPLARFGHGAVAEAGNLFLFGGADDSTAGADTFRTALGGTEYLLESAQDAGFGVAYGSSGWRAGSGGEVAGLTPNRTYHLRVRARSRAGTEGSLVVFGSTLTPAAVPGAAASTFSSVEAGSVTLAWADGGNPAGTEFLAALSTSTDFTAIRDTGWTAAVSSAVFGLSPNATYYAAVLARDSAGRLSREAFLGSTVTAAAAPQSPSFPSVVTTGLTVAWSTAGNPAGTRYEAQLASTPTFSALAASSVTLSSGASFANLLSAATYYLRVRAFNWAGTPSGFSAATQAVTGADFSPPSAVTGLAVHAGETPGVMLAAWTAPGDDGTAGVLAAGSRFYLQWSAADPALVAWSTASAQLSAATGPVTPGASASLVVTGLPIGASVYTRVWAEDESGNVSPPSSTAAAWASPFSLSRLDGATSDAGRSASVALDRSGDAHVAYTAGTITQELRYLKRTGGVWSVAEAPDSGVPAEDALVAVDAAGVPQILYRNSSTGQLRHARRSGAWQASAVATGDMRPGGLALDATGYAHISYYDSALPGLRYARWTGAAWEFEAVNAGPGVGRFSSLALDGAGTPHIAYHDVAGADLKHASRTAAGAWLTSTVDSAGAVGSSPTVVLDGEGRPTVFYVDGGAADLRSARFDGAAWTLSVVDSSAAVSGVGGAALDGAGRAVVSYHDAAAGDLLFARHDGTTWQLGAVDGYGDVGAWSGAAVEADGGLLLVHYASTGGDLRAATWAAGLAAPVGGNPRGRARAPAAFGGVVASSVSIQWTWLDTVPNELGWRLYGALASTGPFTVVAGSAAIPATPGTGAQRIFAESGLTAHTTYYRYVAAVSSGGTVVSPMAAVYPYTTVDLNAPAVVDNQAGDAVWRRAAGALYDVDFTDTGGSALERFSVKASTTAGGLGTDLIGFTDVVTSILSDSYTADWALPAAVFDALLDGATNYVTVRVADGNANAATLLDAFTVLKDTTPPVLADNQADDPVRRAAGGTAYDVDAFDGSSGLDRFQYSVSTAVGSADGGAVGWTDVVLGGGATFYQTNWTLDFAGLLGDATNYVSVRAWDRAGSTVSLADAFSVVKDTGGPRVVIQQPSAAVRSVLTVLSGTAADAAGVGGVQVALQDTPPGGVWFDGTGFTSGTPVWLAAAGTASWTFAGMPTLVDGTAYRVVARSTDSLGNFSVANTTSDFTFDASTPTAAVTVPTSGATLAVLPTLSGTAFDPGAGASGLSLIEVRVRRVSDGLYWNWSADAWGVPAVATTPVTASPWTLGVPAGLRANLAHGASYFVSARGVDNATPPNAGSLAVGSTFTWTDTTAPAAVTDLTALTGSAPGEIVLNWTAPGDDGSAGDIALAEYRVHYSTDSAAVFSTSSAQVAFSTANVKPGTYRGRVVAGLTAGATYHLRLFLADDSGNWSALSNGATVYAGIQPLSRITGFVRKASSEGITAVQLEAYNASDIRVSNAFSLADGSGTFSLDNIPDGVFRVQASWTADEITSSVWLDNVAVGTPEVVFTLEVSYTLSTLTGTLGTLSAQSASAPGFMVRAAENGFGQSRVELLRGGTTVAGVRPDPSGRWIIPNLLPGKYAVRAYNGLEFTDPVDVQLGEGETQEVVFVFDPLPEASVFAFPNPARTQTTFRFVSALPGLEAQVTVFDIAGNLVKELPGSAFVPKPGGLYHGVWDLTNDDGEAVASGVYLFMVKVKGSNGQSGKLIKKIAVVR